MSEPISPIDQYARGWNTVLARSMNYVGYGMYRAGVFVAVDQGRLEEVGITHILSLGEENVLNCLLGLNCERGS